MTMIRSSSRTGRTRPATAHHARVRHRLLPIAVGLAAAVTLAGAVIVAMPWTGPPPAAVNAVVGEVGDCGGQTAGYPNGRIPKRLLCSVGRTDQGDDALLRPDAAAAFEALASAWAADHGSALCVRSAYRTYRQQAALAEEMPDLAAPAGVSEHGWGTAVDLCGGIADASSPQHAWMQRHGPEHGWRQPAWAAPGGSRPEPWHWEYERGPATFSG